MSADAGAIAEALPGYDIGGEIGRGGMGVVRAGVHRSLGRTVAIKELPAGLASDPSVRARFVAEGRMLAMLDHPHIVPVYDYVERDGLCLLVMEQLTGGSIWDRFEADGYRHDQVCAITMVTAVALQHAHGKGLLHRDIKPSNVLVSSTGLLKVTDFGIAQVVGGGETMATATGQLLGTPGYMAPEQAEGKELGPTADVYATGMVAYHLLAGCLPYSDDGGALAIVYRHVYEDPRPLHEVAPTVPPELCAVVMRAIARAPGDRYATAHELAHAMGEAAGAAFGAQWLAASGITLIAPELTHAAGAMAAPPVAASPATVIGAAVPLVKPGVVGPPPKPIDLDHQILIPVQDVAAVAAPRSRRPVRGILGAALLVASVAMAVIGTGGTTSGGTLAGIVTIAGQPLTSGSVNIDLGKPIEVRVSVPEGAAGGPAAARLTIGVAGLSHSGTATLSPATTPGTIVPPSTTLLTPSTRPPVSSPQGTVVPSVAGKSEADARVALNPGGWQIDRIAVANPNIPKGNAIRTDPPAGVVLARGAGIKLYVSLGRADQGALGATELRLVVDKQAVVSIVVSGAKSIAAGKVQGKVELLNAKGDVMGSQSFGVNPISAGLGTTFGLGALALLVLAAGLGAWAIRSRRALPLLIVVGALFGASMSVVAWAAGAGALSTTTVAVCAVLAAAGTALVVDLARRRPS